MRCKYQTDLFILVLPYMPSSKRGVSFFDKFFLEVHLDDAKLRIKTPACKHFSAKSEGCRHNAPKVGEYSPAHPRLPGDTFRANFNPHSGTARYAKKAHAHITPSNPLHPDHHFFIFSFFHFLIFSFFMGDIYKGVG